ncbi:10149_t:CDS:2, partial [Racocetra fulgida]
MEDSNANAKRKRTLDIVVDSPNNLDLDTYIANYKDHNKYLNTANKLNEVLASQGYPSYPVDNAWVETTQKRAKTTLERLEVELKNFKNNLIKESIRSTPDIQPVVQAKLKVAAALAHLDSNKYKQAANLFLETSFEISHSQNNYSEVNYSIRAVYGGLCALASFDRKQLKKQVIDNTEFKQFLELEPHIRELIYGFYNSKYSIVLDILDRWKSFGTTVPKLERELAKLITENHIQARIDSHKKVFIYTDLNFIDHRSGIFHKSLKMGDDFEQSTNAMLLRMNLLKMNLIVQT